MKKFEYLTISMKENSFSINYTAQDFLNEHGKNGWELCSVVAIKMKSQVKPPGASKPVEILVSGWKYFFKREK